MSDQRWLGLATTELTYITPGLPLAVLESGPEVAPPRQLVSGILQYLYVQQCTVVFVVMEHTHVVNTDRGHARGLGSDDGRCGRLRAHRPTADVPSDRRVRHERGVALGSDCGASTGVSRDSPRYNHAPIIGI